MALSSRLRIIVPGAAVVIALGLVVASMSVRSFRPHEEPNAIVLFIGSVLSAPVLLILRWLGWGGPLGPVSSRMAMLALAAIVGVPVHPVIVRRWAIAVTVLGLVSWLLCELIVAAGPA
jgi:hypothetical protein